MGSNCDRDDLAERIIHEIVSGIEKYPDLDEIAIIPVPEQEKNKSPIILAERSLGIESWSYKYIYKYAYSKILKIRQSTTNYRNCPSINNYLKISLMFNSEITTFWNIRRQLYLKNDITLSDDLNLTRLILTIHSKSNQTLAYRRWLLNSVPTPKTTDPLVSDELQICSKIADKVANNYHAWVHRLWLLETLKHSPNHIFSEFNFITNWIQCHVSDVSGLHYFAVVVKTIFDTDTVYYCQLRIGDLNCFRFIHEQYINVPSFENRQLSFKYVFILALFELNSELLDRFANHEALWSHRQNLLMVAVKVLSANRESFEYAAALKGILSSELQLSFVGENDPDFLAKYFNWLTTFLAHEF